MHSTQQAYRSGFYGGLSVNIRNGARQRYALGGATAPGQSAVGAFGRDEPAGVVSSSNNTFRCMSGSQLQSAVNRAQALQPYQVQGQPRD